MNQSFSRDSSLFSGTNVIENTDMNQSFSGDSSLFSETNVIENTDMNQSFKFNLFIIKIYYFFVINIIHSCVPKLILLNQQLNKLSIISLFLSTILYLFINTSSFLLI